MLPVECVCNISSATVANGKVDSIKYVCEYTRLKCCTLLCYLDNHSAIGVMAHATSAFPLIEMTECAPANQGDQMRMGKFEASYSNGATSHCDTSTVNISAWCRLSPH